MRIRVRNLCSLPLLLLITISSLVADRVHAQIPADDPPFRQTVDGNGVDLYAGRMVVRATAITIGSGEGALSYSMTFRGTRTTHSFLGGVRLNTANDLSAVTVYIGDTSESFVKLNGVYVADHVTASTLAQDPATLDFTYTMADGTVATFNHVTVNTYGYYACISSVTRPSGERTDWEYYTSSQKSRVSRLTTTRGYAMELTYGSSDGTSSQFLQLTSVKLENLIDSTASGVPVINLAYGTNWVEFTDALSRVSRITTNSSGVAAIRDPGSSADNVVVSYSGGKVNSVNNHGLVSTYVYYTSGGNSVTSVTGPNGAHEYYTFDGPYRLMTYENPLNRITSYQYDLSARPYQVTYPEGNGVAYSYDARGNVTRKEYLAKPSSGLANLFTTAEFDATCSNPKTCNQPNLTRDTLGNVTNYSYDPVHGGVLAITQPSPGVGLPRPEIRYSYAALEASYKNSSGVMAPSGAPIYELTGTSTCRTFASCTGTADETRTTIDYDPTSSGSNLLPQSVTTQSGDGALVSAVSVTYDIVGNPVTTDGPVTGGPSFRRNRFDALRRIVGFVGPVGDGSGSGQHIAEKITYTALGTVYADAIGTVSGYDDSSWASFSAQYTTYAYYDVAYRPIKVWRTDSWTRASIPTTQLSYDAAGRLQCVALRMNFQVYDSLPSSACTLGTEGFYGPDRITQYSYDAAGRLLNVTAALGVSGQQHTAKAETYSLNGLPVTVTDGNGNKTSYDYDGFDRLLTTYYPDKTTVGQSSTDDTERYLYIGPYLMQSSNRDGTWNYYAYDNLGRVTYSSSPGHSDEDVYYQYDNQGRPLSSRFGSQGGVGITRTYDGLGRLESKTSYGRTLSYLYNAAGQVQRIIYPDGFYANYDYNLAGELNTVSDSAGNLLATMLYDWLGRKTVLARGSYSGGTATTGWAYDSSFPTSLASVGNGVIYGAPGYSANLSRNTAGEIILRSVNDPTYAWERQGQHDASSLSYTRNGLNQVTQVGASPIGYDANGNLVTGDIHWTFSYDGRNQLRTATSAANTLSLQYDPEGLLHRLDQSSGPSTEFLFDGTNLVAEYDSSGNLLRRYVYGPGDAAPYAFGPGSEALEWYEGAGTTDRRTFFPDERGSIVAVGDAAGNTLSTFAYSPDGESNSVTGSRFLYTGQPYIPELGLTYYKARFYSALLGRFLQPDPIGYGDGMNRYAYVRGNPVNLIDPLGLGAKCSDEEETRTLFDECELDDVTVNGYDNYNGHYGDGELPGIAVTGNRMVAPYAPIAPLGFGFSSGGGGSGGHSGGASVASQGCTTARAALGSLGKQLSSIGKDLTWTGVGSIGLSGVAAIFLPEGLPGEIAGAEAGADMIELGGLLSNLGATLQGYAQGGGEGAAFAAVDSIVMERTFGRAASRLSRGASSATRSSVAALLDKASEAFDTEEVACGE